MDASGQAAPPPYSADGRWWWNGESWQPVTQDAPPDREPAASTVFVHCPGCGVSEQHHTGCETLRFANPTLMSAVATTALADDSNDGKDEICPSCRTATRHRAYCQRANEPRGSVRPKPVTEAPVTAEDHTAEDHAVGTTAAEVETRTTAPQVVTANDHHTDAKPGWSIAMAFTLVGLVFLTYGVRLFNDPDLWGVARAGVVLGGALSWLAVFLLPREGPSPRLAGAARGVGAAMFAIGVLGVLVGGIGLVAFHPGSRIPRPASASSTSTSNGSVPVDLRTSTCADINALPSPNQVNGEKATLRTMAGNEGLTVTTDMQNNFIARVNSLCNQNPNELFALEASAAYVDVTGGN